MHLQEISKISQVGVSQIFSN